MSVAAIVLAAGRGTRFGAEPKLLASLDGRALVRHVAEAAIGSSARPVLVVTGHRAPTIEEALAGLDLAVLRNPSYAEGLSTSLRAGFRELPREARAAIVLLGDMPRVSSGLINRLITGWTEAREPLALVPTLDGRRGNPVVLSRRLAPEIAALSGDMGAGPLLRRREGVVEVAVDDPAVLLDVDTPEALGPASLGGSRRDAGGRRDRSEGSRCISG